MPKLPFILNQALGKAYRRQKVDRVSMEAFRKNLSALLGELDEQESEEHLKNDVIRFLDNTWYKDNFAINTKGKTDLVIHTDRSTKSKVGVLLEVKKPSNKGEMVSREKLNTKALQELLLYYLRERVAGENNEIKHLAVTNVHEWFIFDASEFYTKFYKNTKLLKEFEDWNAGKKDSSNTELFYTEIARKYIEEVEQGLQYTYFDFRDFIQFLNKKEDSRKLIALYKILSPVHLLKLSVGNDSNSLDRKFYNELLHVIGLEEVKEKGKKLIRRKAEGKRNDGSLLENAINIMDERDCLNHVDRPSQYGSIKEDQLYAIALELCITWINRILFLKLLESQLVGCHKGDVAYKFLSQNKVPNYDALGTLFFGVLAKKTDERLDRVNKKFMNVPYLNSSLFEPTELERVMPVTSLDSNLKLELHGQTVLKNENSKKLSGKRDTLTYLFDFLDAYDFSSEGTEDIQEESKTLINASVLGLIFEKINGYKDGSFYTPGFITMYMCKETIRRAVLQKFNEAKGWECKDFVELYNKIVDKKEANAIVNSLRICDPAVGSGHFLVSALNEMIAIKSELKILMDREGKTFRDYDLTIENDELVVTDDNGDLFHYMVGNTEKKRLQEALFHEKQTVIENCLFGVDINPNSVKICQLRLWIELLKNAYYKNDTELETLPNIDINIKCGNSLISRFGLDSDLSKALKKSKWDVSTYRNAVHNYKNAQNKEDKREFERLIATIKDTFETSIANYSDPRKVKMAKLGEKLFKLTGVGRGGTSNMLFEPEEQYGKDKKLLKERRKEIEQIEKQIEKLSTEIDEIKNNRIYENAFEWRFEFPEILDDDGTFLGFDVVVGNPPYIRQEEIKDYSKYLNETFNVHSGKADIYVYFFELGLNILRSEGSLTFITSGKFLEAGYGQKLIEYLLKESQLQFGINFNDLEVFDGVSAYPFILSVLKGNYDSDYMFNYTNVENLNFSAFDDYKKKDTTELVISKQGFVDADYKFLKPEVSSLISKLVQKSKSFELVYDLPIVGIKTGFNEGFLTKKPVSQFVKPYAFGKDIKRYKPVVSKNNVIFPYTSNYELINLDESEEIEPLLLKNETGLSQRAIIKDGLINGSKKWYEYQQVNKTISISDEVIVYPNVSLGTNFTLSSNVLIDMTGFVIKSNSKYLLGLLNSKLFEFLLNIWAIGRRGGYKELKVQYIKKLPIIESASDYEGVVENKVNEILALKKENPDADTNALEAEVDQLVYTLYGLTEEEIKIVEGSA
ncbi:Eco57I restriction-modification methylase domain-containing protein [Reichenbachiella sp. MALMAid0571]|uniref:type IIG restriction enzyme/methyltransferase n=1 Tax=Reichenbachiella sp. MALMAid0571 TaxID=3143939 RepID=UPI0032DF90ED